MSEAQRLFIGLGNPGDEYANTYHNAGKLFIEYLCEKESLALETPSRKHFAYAKSKHGICAIPLTFMNTSGRPVHEMLDFFAATPATILVAHDDSDLPIGTYKITMGGGSAGHHGLDSIFEAIGTPEFCRIRIGVRNPDEIMRQKAGEFVLKHISTEDKKNLYGVFDELISNVIEKETP